MFRYSTCRYEKRRSFPTNVDQISLAEFCLLLFDRCLVCFIETDMLNLDGISRHFLPNKTETNVGRTSSQKYECV